MTAFVKQNSYTNVTFGIRLDRTWSTDRENQANLRLPNRQARTVRVAMEQTVGFFETVFEHEWLI